MQSKPLKSFLPKVTSADSLKLFVDSLKTENAILLEGLFEGPIALLLSLAKKHLKSPLLVISKRAHLFDDLSYYLEENPLDFPSWETLPGEGLNPSPDIVGKRLEFLHRLLKEKRVVITSLQGALQKVPEKKYLSKKFLTLKIEDEISFPELESKLKKLGYKKASVASDKGEYAIRGGIFDIYPINALDPCRIDFFGDTIEQIRTYEPLSQMSSGKIPSILISPAIEEPTKTSSLLEFMGKETLLVFDDLLQLEDRLTKLKSLPSFNHLSTIDELIDSPNKKIYLIKEKVHELSETKLEMFGKKIDYAPVSHGFYNYDNTSSIEEHTGPLHLIVANEAEENAIQSKFPFFPPHVKIERGYLTSGFLLLEKNLLVVTYPELTGRYKINRSKYRNSYQTPPSEFHELQLGDLVVHFHNGIGKYIGLEKQTNHLGDTQEFMVIEYAERSKLFVPLSQSHLVSRYIGSGEVSPKLHTLGTKSWQKAKVKVQKQILGYAKDLLNFQAVREVKGGYVFRKDSDDMQLFEEEFPYAETKDQMQAIQDIKDDMQSEKAMDRLICGDVGFGKTEVAMRAAFKAVLDGNKQVAVLVPTTILAMQHFETFVERMSDFPINIGVISRFNKPKQIKETLQKAAEGKLDILVGTHRLLSKDVSFKNLGMIIIDEEHRFGVRAKEHLKNLKIGVDCITLSATPIPRTLYFSLLGAKDMSIISTPPQDRLPIRTVLAARENSLIKNAILRELAGGGQVFFIHNRVESIYTVAKELKSLVPTAKIGVAHGQLKPDEIDTVFHEFKSHISDILIATTIVENGIDIPNANTIFIDRAQNYGLADLYQLRGRVGRWNKPAYAYFLTPKRQALSQEAKKRLSALVETSSLGCGLKLAMRDLEIRGAGDILGVQQSGNVSQIGFHLYCKLLRRAIETIKRKIPITFADTKMEFSFDASIPADYLPEVSLRIEFYHRLGDAMLLEEVDKIASEIKDRFGPLPKPLVWLYHLTRIRIRAATKGVTYLIFKGRQLTYEKDKIKGTLPLVHINNPRKLEDEIKKYLNMA